MKGLAFHVKQTAAFIDENPADIVLTRRAKVATAAGGWKWNAGAPLQPLHCRYVAQVRTGTHPERLTEDGRLVVPTAVLVCMPEADIQNGDLFAHEGYDHEVVFINDGPEWARRAEVVRLSMVGSNGSGT